ncbi:MAG: M3 family metallopeptidase, partial [Bdellovibrionia bacterium]
CKQVVPPACTSRSASSNCVETQALIRYEYKPGEIKAACDQAIADATAKLDQLAKLNSESFETSMMTFESVLADYSDLTTPLIFMAYVSTDEKLREEASGCEENVGKFGVSVFTRKDLYGALKKVVPQSADQKRLVSETLKAFEKNGLMLSDEKLKEVRLLKQTLAELESKFSSNLNNDTTTVNFTAEQLAGVSQDFLEGLKKTADGKYIVTTKGPHYVHVTENAKNSETRKAMLMAYLNRAADKNPKLLEEAVTLRQKIATLMGYKTWADYRTDGRMALSGKAVATFLGGLQGKLSERNKADIAKLLAHKKTLDPQATKVDAWDINYLAYQVKKKEFTLDDEKIREYFPSDFVIKGMFEVYSTILGVDFIPETKAKVWQDSVKLYKIVDRATGEKVAYFFADLIPREGKYGHAAAFPLISGRLMKDGYTYPVASMVANMNAPVAGKPSLLNIDEVETLFHEFGHIMHQTLTKAPYASLSGTAVAQDFVEAPSQMLENWVWDSAILNKISGHYKNTSQKLPTDMLEKILAAKDFNQGYFYTRQLFLGIMDLTMHTANGAVDTTVLHDLLYKEIIGIEPLKGNHFNGTFGHLMGGYDAGYYGYLWSEVYAQDMFTIFKKNGLLDPKTGGRYRSIILEKGNMKEPLDLVRQFLEREPSNAAFYEKLGIKP